MVLGRGRSLNVPATKTDALSRFRRADEELSEEEERYRAELFSRAILAVASLWLLAVTAELVAVPGAHVGPLATAAAVLGIIAAALQMRRGRYNVSAAVVLGAVILVCALSGLGSEPNRIWWAYMLIPVVLASTFVSRRGAAATSLVTLAVTLIVFAIGGSSIAAIIPQLSFFLVLAPLLLFVAYQRDGIEERRRAESLATKLRLDRAERLAGVGHWEVDGDTVRLSPAARATLGTSRREITLDELCERMVDGREGFDAFVEARHSSMSWASVKYRRAEDERFAVITCLDKGAQPLFCTFQDTTDLMNERFEEERLRRQLHDAERLEAIGRVVGGVAHDFNNLLTVMQASAEFIRECGDGDCDEYLDALEEATGRGQRLTRDLLNSARGAETKR